ncbi:MAG: GatB/YqeY domain-containing protein [Myxococcota bacterium]
MHLGKVRPHVQAREGPGRLVLGPRDPDEVKRFAHLFTRRPPATSNAEVNMGIVEQVNDQMKDAMRAKDKARLAGLKGIRAAFIEALKEEGAGDTLPDDVAVGILRRLAKQRRESITAYEAGGRDDLVDQEKTELAVIEAFLPSLADEATTRTWVEEAIAKTGAASPADMGKVMGALMGAHKGELDGALANKIVRELLAGGA